MLKNRYIPRLEQLDEKVMPTATPLPAPDLSAVPAQMRELLTPAMDAVHIEDAAHDDTPAPEHNETTGLPGHAEESQANGEAPVSEHSESSPVEHVPTSEHSAEQTDHGEGHSTEHGEAAEFEYDVTESYGMYHVHLPSGHPHCSISVHSTKGDYEMWLADGQTTVDLPVSTTLEAELILDDGTAVHIDLHKAHHEAVEFDAMVQEFAEAEHHRKPHDHHHEHEHGHEHPHEHIHEHVHKHEHKHEHHEHEEEKEEGEEETLTDLEAETDRVYREFIEARSHGNGDHKADELRRRIERELHEIEHRQQHANAQTEPQHVRYLRERSEYLENMLHELPPGNRGLHRQEHRREIPGHHERNHGPAHPPHPTERHPMPVHEAHPEAAPAPVHAPAGGGDSAA